MAKPSLLARMRPHGARTKPIPWPLPCEGERPTVVVRALGSDEFEEAYFATQDHFKDRKPKVALDDPTFLFREKVETIFRAYRTEGGDPIAASADELAGEPFEVITELYEAWRSFHDSVSVAPKDAKEFEQLVADLKKNGLAGRLLALSSSELNKLRLTLAFQPADSTPDSERGSQP